MILWGGIVSAHHINHMHRNPTLHLFFCAALIKYSIHEQLFISFFVWDVDILPLKRNYHVMTTLKPISSSCGNQPVVTPSGVRLRSVKILAIGGDIGKSP